MWVVEIVHAFYAKELTLKKSTQSFAPLNRFRFQSEVAPPGKGLLKLF